jgi:hypothetical protein
MWADRSIRIDMSADDDIAGHGISLPSHLTQFQRNSKRRKRPVSIADEPDRLWTGPDPTEPSDDPKRRGGSTPDPAISTGYPDTDAISTSFVAFSTIPRNGNKIFASGSEQPDNIRCPDGRGVEHIKEIEDLSVKHWSVPPEIGQVGIEIAIKRKNRASKVAVWKTGEHFVGTAVGQRHH